METRELAEVLLQLRRELFRIVVIVLAASSLFFTFGANALIGKIQHDLFPGAAALENREEILKISEGLKNVSATLENYANYPTEENRTAALKAAKELVRLAMRLTTSPILVTPLEGLLLNLKLSLAVGVAAALPYVAFVFYRTLRERGIIEVSVTKLSAFRYAVASGILFTLGVLYGYYMMKFFIQFLYMMAVRQGAVPLYSLSEFINFVVLMLVLFGFVFQLPIVLFFLVRNSIVSYETLKYYRRHIYVAFFVIGAITTPPDVFTQIMVAVPMLVFFEASMLFVRLFANPARFEQTRL